MSDEEIIAGIMRVEAYNDQFRKSNPNGSCPVCTPMLGTQLCERCGGVCGNHPCPATDRSRRWGPDWKGAAAQGGYVVEKCRLCGKVIDSTTHVPNMYVFLRFTTTGTPAPSDGGLPAYSMSVHACAGGNIGVTDVIGCIPDKEEVKA